MLLGCSGKPQPPVAENGLLDLSAWDFEKNGIVRLNGEWEFYWHQLLTPEDFNRPAPPKMNPPEMTGFFSPPGAWDGYMVSGKAIGPHGYATFRLTVTLPPALRQLTLDLWHGAGAYQIWLDDRPMFDNPQVGKDRASTLPIWGADEKTFLLSNDSVVITLQKANFYGHSGSFGTLLAGTAHQIRRERSVMSVMELFCLGSLVVMGIYHLFLFWFRQKDNPPFISAWYACCGPPIRRLPDTAVSSSGM